MKDKITIEVECCWECGKDNFQHNLVEIKFKDRKKSIWLCNHCLYNNFIPSFIDMGKLKHHHLKGG